MVTTTGEIKAGHKLQIGARHVSPRSRRSENHAAEATTQFCGSRGNLRMPLAARKFYFLAPLHTPFAQVRKSLGRFPKRLSVRVREPREPQSAPRGSEIFIFWTVDPLGSTSSSSRSRTKPPALTSAQPSGSVPSLKATWQRSRIGRTISTPSPGRKLGRGLDHFCEEARSRCRRLSPPMPTRMKLTGCGRSSSRAGPCVSAWSIRWAVTKVRVAAIVGKVRIDAVVGVQTVI